MYHGVINVYKEPGFTSHDVVAKLRGILRQKRIGHTGTLDPAAEGVLPVCLGQGTRLADMLTDKTKTYEAVLLLGMETDTQDTTGRVLARYPVQVTEEEVRRVAASFVGDYNQIPPMYSALKVDGKKLYELARAGKEVAREARKVRILQLSIDWIRLPRAGMTVTCSKGTYIRTLCHDIGQALECGGCMEHLKRTRTGPFAIEDSLTLSQIEALRDEEKLGTVITPIEELFDGDHVIADARWDKLVLNGNPIKADIFNRFYREEKGNKSTKDKAAEPVCIYSSSREFLGVYEYDESRDWWKPKKMFPREKQV